MDHRPVSARVLQGVAFALTVAVSLAVQLVPMYTVQPSSGGSGNPNGQVVNEHLTLLTVNGPVFFVPLLISVILTGCPLLIPGKPWKGMSIAATVLLAAFLWIGSASVGWFYVPALLASAGALLVRPAERDPLRNLEICLRWNVRDLPRRPCRRRRRWMAGSIRRLPVMFSTSELEADSL